VDIKNANDSLRREILYDILFRFGIPVKIVRLIEMCLNETCTKIHVGKHWSDAFSVQNDVKQGDPLSQFL
jgi:hypothetical protein